MSHKTIKGNELPRTVISKKIKFEMAMLNGAMALLIVSSTPAAEAGSAKRLDRDSKKAFNILKFFAKET